MPPDDTMDDLLVRVAGCCVVAVCCFSHVFRAAASLIVLESHMPFFQRTDVFRIFTQSWIGDRKGEHHSLFFIYICRNK